MSEYKRIWDEYQMALAPILAKRNAKIRELQDSCKHEETQWAHTYWAPGHQGADILECKRCGKNLTPAANTPHYEKLEKDLLKTGVLRWE